jgi:hypothetical protein
MRILKFPYCKQFTSPIVSGIKAMLKIILISSILLFLVFGLLFIQVFRGSKSELRSGCCSMVQGQDGDNEIQCGCVSGSQEKS